MKTKLLAFGILTALFCATAPVYGQALNNFEAGSPEVTATYGAEFAIVANPVVDGNNPTMNCGQIKRTSGNWYEIVRFGASFSVPANTTKYIHMLVRYTSSVVPNMSVRIDAAADNDGSADIHPVNSYATPGVWQDMVFEVPGGEFGVNPTQFLFFADASVAVLNSTDSFAYIDEIVVNDNATPAGYEENMMLNDFEALSPNVSASYGAAYANVANPLVNETNPTANAGEIKRTSGNWYELIRFATYFNVPANSTKYIHALVKYTTTTVPNMSVRIDAATDNDGSTDIHPVTDYTMVGEWQDMVFEIPGGDTGVTPTQLLFFADAGVAAINNTDSFAYIDQILINNDAASSTPLGTIAVVQNTGVKVYPNPTASVWNFEIANANGVSSVQILDVTGKMVLSKNLTSANTTVDASGLSKGMYFAKITSGTAVQTVKVIKK